MYDSNINVQVIVVLNINTSKVDMPNSISDLNHAPIFEWYVVKYGSMNKYQKSSCLKEIGLHAQNMINVLGSTMGIRSCKALHSTVLDIATNCYALKFKWKLDICMMKCDNHLRRSNEILNKLTLNVKRKKIMH